MKENKSKNTILNKIIWTVIIIFSVIFWGVCAVVNSKGGLIIIIAIMMFLCAAAFVWAICFHVKLWRTKQEEKHLFWESIFLYSGLWLVFFGIDLNFALVALQVKSTEFCLIFVVLAIASFAAMIIYEIIGKSGFLNKSEEPIAVFISVLIVGVFVGAYYYPAFLAVFFIKLLMTVIAISMSILMIKKFVVEQVNLKTLQSITNFLFLFLTTIAAIVISIYLLFWKQEATNQDLFTSIMGVFAGVLGGSLTLAGVAWTIRRQDEIHKKDEQSKFKPMFRYCAKEEIKKADIIQNFFFHKTEIIIKDYHNRREHFKNFDNANFLIESIEVNGNEFTSIEYAFVEKGNYFYIDFPETELGVQTLYFNVKDVLGNKYRFELIKNEGMISGIREIKGV